MLVFAKLVTPTYKIVKKVEIGFLGLNYGVVSNWVKESVKLIYMDYIAIHINTKNINGNIIEVL